jgi:hypothetical protein
MNQTSKTFLLILLSTAILLTVQTTLFHAQVSNALSPEKIKAALDEAFTKFKDVKEGKNADHIPK